MLVMAKLNFSGLFEYSVINIKVIYLKQIFYNIINVIAVTSDKCNTSLTPKF